MLLLRNGLRSSRKKMAQSCNQTRKRNTGRRRTKKKTRKRTARTTRVAYSSSGGKIMENIWDEIPEDYTPTLVIYTVNQWD